MSVFVAQAKSHGIKCNPLQYFCLENSMGSGAWWAIVHGVTKSQSWLTYTHSNSDAPLATTRGSLLTGTISPGITSYINNLAWWSDQWGMKDTTENSAFNSPRATAHHISLDSWIKKLSRSVWELEPSLRPPVLAWTLSLAASYLWLLSKIFMWVCQWSFMSVSK